MVNILRIMKYNGDGDDKGDGAVQEEAAANVLGNVTYEMGDGLEVAIEVKFETTGANAEHQIHEDATQTMTQPKCTQQEYFESTAEHEVLCSEPEQVETLPELEAENAQ